MLHTHGVGCTCSECHDHEHGDENRKLKIAQIVIAAVFYIVGMLAEHIEAFGIAINPLYFFIVGYVIVGASVVIGAIKNIFKGNFFDETFLMSVATICAFFVQEYSEAVMVMLLFQIGELLQDIAVDNSHKSIKNLLDMKEIVVHKVVGEETEDVEIEKAIVGDIFLVKPGERIPLDGKVVEGTTSLDMSPLSGESIPVEKQIGDEVLSGSINLNGLIKVRAEKAYDESTVNKILECIENATVSKTQSEKFVTKFSKIYTPIVVAAAVLLVAIPSIINPATFSTWLYKACILLVVSCPCALVISVPLAYFIGIGVSSKKGILMKGSNYLEILDKMDTVLFDKTGTLTKGKLSVTKVVSENQKEILDAAALVEKFSTHPIAKAIANMSEEVHKDHEIDNYKEVFGEGIEAVVDGEIVKVGKIGYVGFENQNTSEEAGTIVHVSKGGKYLGYIVVSDTVKNDAKTAMSQLKTKGVRTVMVSGDNERNAKSVGDNIGIDDVHYNLLPNQKVEVLDQYLEHKGTGKVGFVGDGINDAPVIAKSDVGIAMGGLGSEAAIEVSDVVVMNDSLSSLVNAKEISKQTIRIVYQNIVMIIVIKSAAMILGIFDALPMWGAVISDVGVCLLAILNALRLFKYARK